MQEIWKQVKLGMYEYPYQVSNLGTVKNSAGKIPKPWMRGQRKGTYPAVKLYRYGPKKVIDVHRLVALHFIPNPQYKPEVNHLDLDHMNPRSDNLEWCTRSENEAHKHFMNAHLELEAI